jgi:hypothetical protein
MKSRVEKFYKVQGAPLYPHIILQENHFRMQYDEKNPLFISLQVNNKLLNNCMLDLGAGASIMSLKVMRKLGLETTRPYTNLYGIESRVIPTYGLIENVKVFLNQYPEMVFLVDIVVVDVPDVWGMLFYRIFFQCLAVLYRWI